MGSGIAMKKFGMRDSREKGAGIRDQDPPPPLPDPGFTVISPTTSWLTLNEL